nr:hypothetical protein [Tanacetum cinerariifolium]
MDQQNPTLAKIPILDTGKFEQWQFQIQQYLQHEHYALWEVIEFGDSYEAPKEDAATASDGSAKKKGRTVIVTTEDMQKRKNGVKARTTLLFYQEDKKNLLKQQYGNFKVEGSETLEQTLINYRAPRSQERGRRENYKQGSKVEEHTPKALMAIDRVGGDWSFMANEQEDHALVANEEAPTEFGLIAKTCAECEVFDNSLCSKNCKKNTVSLNKLLKKEKGELDTKLTGFQTASKDLDNLLESQRLDKNKEGLGYSAIPLTAQVYSPPKKDLSWTGIPEFADDTVTDYSRPSPAIESTSDDVQNRNSFETEASSSTISSKPFIKFVKATVRPTENKIVKVESIKKHVVKACFYYGHFDHLSNDCGLGVKKGRSYPKNNCSNKSMTPKAVIHKPYRPPMRPVRPTMNVAQPKRTSFYKITHSYSKRPFQRTSAVRHMTGYISYLSDYELFDGGYVSIGQGGCKITGKGTIKTDKLEFENVYFIKDLKYKLFSVSQICDNKNRVLFTNSECIVLGRDFKLIDDTNVLLRTLRKHNMYSINLNNIVPHKDLTCLVAKASADECMLWHRRLGPNWLFDIDSLTKSMNYVPVVGACIHSINFSGTKDAASEVVKKDVSSLRYIALSNWVHDALLDSTSSNAQDTCTSDAPESSRNPNPTTSTTNPSADPMETLAVETPIPTVSSPVSTACFTDSQDPSSDTRLISKRVTNQEETPSLDNILTLTNRFEDIIGVTTNSDDLNGVEADVSNIETTIIASPTPTLKIHKDHPKSQIIGPVDTLIQTRHKSKEDKMGFKNKKDERGIVIRNKARLVAQGHTQEEGIDYDEVFAPVARIKAIKLFLAYAFFVGFTVYQMDVKSAFLYDTIDEEVYVMQPPRFQDPEFPAKVSIIDQNLFIRRHRGDFILVQVYVDDIIFGSSNPQLCREFEALMHEKFQMSAMDIMFAVCACARHQVTSKECHLHVVKRIFIYLKGHPKLGLWYPKESPFDLVAYSDSDYGGATQNRKSTTRGCQFLAASSCGQVMWIQNQLFDYGLSIPCEALSKEISSSILLLRNLKLNDEAGISSLLDVELFENLQLMGYNILPNQKFTFQKGQFSHPWKYFIHTIMQCLKPKSTGFNEFSSNIATALVCLATNKVYNFLKMIFDGKGEGLGTPTESHHTPTSKASQSSHHELPSPSLPPVPTESLPTIIPSDKPLLGNILEELGLLIPQLFHLEQSEMVSKFEAQELEINSLKATIKLLEDKDRGVADQSRDDAPIKGRSPAIPTASPIFTTATENTQYTRRKGKETMVESETPKKKKVQEQIDIQLARELEEEMARDAQRMNDQIARDTEIARNHAEEELQMLIDGLDRNNKTVSKYLSEYYQFATELPIERRIELINDLWQDFIPSGSKEEAGRFKRKGLRLEQESVKKLKTLEEVKATEEVPEEKVKEMMQLVPIEEVYVEAVQVKHPIIDWKVHTEGQRSYWKIIRLGGSSASYQFFVNMLKHLDREDLNQLWRLLKESLSIRPATNDKEMELWVKLKRLYEPDAEDQLWNHTQNMMHAPIEWKLYDSCGVHHVTFKDKEILMLVEKDYPIRKSLAIVMISSKLQVENYS